MFVGFVGLDTCISEETHNTTLCFVVVCVVVIVLLLPGYISVLARPPGAAVTRVRELFH